MLSVTKINYRGGLCSRQNYALCKGINKEVHFGERMNILVHIVIKGYHNYLKSRKQFMVFFSKNVVWILNFCYYVCFWKCTHSFNLWEVRQNRCIALWNGQDSNWSTVGWIFKSTVRKSLTFLLHLKLSNETFRETNVLEKQNASGSHSVRFWVLLKIYFFKWKKERWNK